jgi:cytoskeletal protein RodZ
VIEIGKALREAREAKGLSMDDIQELTKIQKRYLEAIEEGNYSILPGQFYVKAFIRQYAEAVGLDTAQYMEVNNASVSQEITEKEEIEPVKEDIPSRSAKVREPINVKSSQLMDYLPRILIGVLVIGIIVVIWMLIPNNNNKNVKNNSTQSSNTSEIEKPKNNPLDQQTKDNQQTTDGQKQEDVQPVTPKQVLTVASAKGRNSTIEVSNNEALKVDISAPKGDVYLGVKNDQGKSFFDSFVKEGKTQSFDFTNENEVTLNIGATQNVEIRINDEVLQLPIDPSAAVHQHITIKNVK